MKFSSNHQTSTSTAQGVFQQIVSIDCGSIEINPTEKGQSTGPEQVKSLPDRVEDQPVQTGDSNSSHSEEQQIQGKELQRMELQRMELPGNSKTGRSATSEQLTEGNSGQETTRLYRIDKRHDRFQPSGLLSRSNLHLAVKAEPAIKTIEVEQLVQQQKAKQISEGSEMQQFLVSTYQSIEGNLIAGLENSDNEQIDFDAQQVMLDLPQIGQQRSTLADTVGNEQQRPTPAEAKELQNVPHAQPLSSQPTSSQPLSSQPLSSQPLSSQPLSSLAEDRHAGLQSDNQRVRQLIASLGNQPEQQPVIAETRAPADLRASIPVTDSISTAKKPVIETIKPAWEVAAFRWPTHIQKLCGNHRSAFTRLLDSLPDNRVTTTYRIGVVHALSGQGATTLSACLAKILSDNNAKVLLADLDIESPGIEMVANIQLNQGWQELLSKTDSINEYLVRDASGNLVLMPLTPSPQLVGDRPALLGKAKEASFQLASHFDYSIFDIGNVRNLMVDENCHVGFLDAVIIVSDSSGEESTAVQIYEKLIAAGVPAVVIAENFRNNTKTAA